MIIKKLPLKNRIIAKKYTHLVIGIFVGLFILLTTATYRHVNVPQELVTRKPTVLSASSQLLPGEKIWNYGASSLLFGTNNTYEYSVPNIMTDQTIQQQLKQAGFTLLRTDFFDRVNYWQPYDPVKNPWPPDTQIDARIQVVENTGATCLGDIFSPNIAYAKHLVSYLGNRCLLYEFGNEPNTSGGLYSYTVQDFLTLWNQAIPQLRAINPHAKFIAPTLDYNGSSGANGLNTYMKAFLEGVKASGVLPDALSFHFYPCLNAMSESVCLAHATDAVAYIASFRLMEQQILGKTLPIGISEWNVYSAPPYPAYSIDPSGRFQQEFAKTVLTSFINAKLDFAAQFDAASGANTPIPGAGFLDLFDVYNKTDKPKPQFYTVKDIIRQYDPAFTTPTPSPTPTPPPFITPTTIANSCPIPKLKMTAYCGGSQMSVSHVLFQWNNVIPGNNSVKYKISYSLTSPNQTSKPYFSKVVYGSGQKNGDAFADYPAGNEPGFSPHEVIYGSITYIDKSCASNTNAGYADVITLACPKQTPPSATIASPVPSTGTVHMSISSSPTIAVKGVQGTPTILPSIPSVNASPYINVLKTASSVKDTFGAFISFVFTKIL